MFMNPISAMPGLMSGVPGAKIAFTTCGCMTLPLLPSVAYAVAVCIGVADSKP